MTSRPHQGAGVSREPAVTGQDLEPRPATPQHGTRPNRVVVLFYAGDGSRQRAFEWTDPDDVVLETENEVDDVTFTILRKKATLTVTGGSFRGLIQKETSRTY